jgi:peptide/nickel transport system permease protein
MNRAMERASGRPDISGARPWTAAGWLGLVLAGGVLILFIPAPPAGAPLEAPGLAHWLGTDMLGRDLGARLLQGGARSLLIATAALAFSTTLGGIWGIAAGFGGGWADRILTRMMDIALSVPALVLALLILAALGPGDAAVTAAVGLGGAPTYARLARAAAAQVRPREFLAAAQSLGAGRLRLVARHLLPNIASPLAAYAVLHFGWALVNAASLTFLGFGGSPSAPEWGRMLADARLVFGQAPWQAAAPGLALALTVLAVQRLGEWWLGRE